MPMLAAVMRLGLAVILACATAGPAAAQDASWLAGQVRLLQGRKLSASAGDRKIDSALRTSAVDLSLRSALPPDSAGASRFEPWREGSMVHVYVHVDSTGPPFIAALEAAGFRAEIVNDRFGLLQGWVADTALDAVAALPVVRSIQPVEPPAVRTGAVTSQGDTAARANLVRALGFDGSGVRIGVISDGIDSLARSTVTGDLTEVFRFNDARCRAGSGDEGTVMLEIVHDLAPGAQLFFSPGLQGKLEFIDSVNCLAGGGVNVLVDDIGFFDEPFFEDGAVAQTVRAAVGAGVSYHSAAGNEAGKFIQQDFQADPTGVFHTFRNGDVYEDMIVDPGGVVQCFLQWNDPFGQSANDYDLLLVERSTTTIVSSGTNLQAGGQDPLERAGFVNLFSRPLVVGAVIGKQPAAQTRRLRLFCPKTGRNDKLPYYSLQQDIYGHPALPEVIAVGAIDVRSPGLNTVESFSSRGPAVIFFPSVAVRPKPDMAGFDYVSTTAPGFQLFPGTSAAAPHSAAVAGLLLSKNPFLTPAQIMAALTTTAVDIEAPGRDDASGAGRLDALLALAAVAAPECLRDANCTRSNICSRAATCDRGTCRQTPVVCNDGIACTIDSCDPTLGCQSAVPPGLAGAACEIRVATSTGPCAGATFPRTLGLRLRRAATAADNAAATVNPKRAKTKKRAARAAVKRALAAIRPAQRRGLNSACAVALSTALGDNFARLF